MAFKVLRQAAPSATTATDIYTVPKGGSAVTSTLWICNRGTSTGTIRVAVRLDSSTLADTLTAGRRCRTPNCSNMHKRQEWLDV